MSADTPLPPLRCPACGHLLARGHVTELQLPCRRCKSLVQIESRDGRLTMELQPVK